jgi:predicted RNA-binding protein with PUA-like domain
MKSEPGTWSWEDQKKQGKRGAEWDGVRNYQARNNLRAMKVGDYALYYHSNEGKEVVGIAKVTRSAYPDPTTDDERWVVVDVAPVKPLKAPVTLAQIKADPKLGKIPLVTHSRLSVMPLEKADFDRILELGKVPPTRR